MVRLWAVDVQNARVHSLLLPLLLSMLHRLTQMLQTQNWGGNWVRRRRRRGGELWRVAAAVKRYWGAVAAGAVAVVVASEHVAVAVDFEGDDCYDAAVEERGASLVENDDEEVDAARVDVGEGMALVTACDRSLDESPERD